MLSSGLHIRCHGRLPTNIDVDGWLDESSGPGRSAIILTMWTCLRNSKLSDWSHPHGGEMSLSGGLGTKIVDQKQDAQTQS